MPPNDTEATPDKIKKKNVTFETVKSIFAGFGATLITLTAATLLTRRVKAETLKNTKPPIYERLRKVSLEDFKGMVGNSAFLLFALAPFSAVFGLIGQGYAAWHNQRVDSFTKKAEQNTATDTTVSSPSGSISIHNTEATPNQIKNNVAFETVKSVLASFGTMAAALAITSLVRNRSLLKQTSPSGIEYTEKEKLERHLALTRKMGNSVLTFLPLAPASAIAGLIGYKNAVRHNQEVDSFTQRIEEKAGQGRAASPSAPSP